MSGPGKPQWPRSFCSNEYRKGYRNPVVEALACQMDRLWEADLTPKERRLFMELHEHLCTASNTLGKAIRFPETSLRPDTPRPLRRPEGVHYADQLAFWTEASAGYIRRMETYVDQLRQKYLRASDDI